MNKLMCLLREEDGATSIEYGLIALLVAVAAIAAMMVLGKALSNSYSNTAAVVGNTPGNR